jgi:sugar/nucleoside kinase (ribokinase family)
VNEIEVALRQIVREQVVSLDLEVRVRELGEHGRIDVGGHHGPLRSNSLGQPGRDRAAPGADLQATPTGPDAARGEVPDRPLVQQRLERPQALTLDGTYVVEGVRALGPCHDEPKNRIAPGMTPEEQPKPDSNAEVLCAGIVVADAIASPVDQAPEPGVVNLVESVQLATGGCALSTATALARLGVGTALCGCVGRDLLGQVLLTEAASRGLDTESVRVCDELTSASLVLDRSDGERTFLHNPGASGALTREDVARAVARTQPRLLHVGGALVMPALDGKPLADALRAARGHGVVTSLDPVHDATGRWDRLHVALPHLDVICPNLTEARGVTGRHTAADCAGWLRARGVAKVAIKLGRDGAYALEDAGGEHVPPFEVQAKDETGAGDAFAAGLVCGLLRDWPLRRAVRLANAVGALSTTAVGASTALPDLKGALEFAGLEREPAA